MVLHISEIKRTAMDIVPGTLVAIVLEMAIFLPRFEVIYSPDRPSGTYGMIIVLMDIIIAVAVLGICNVRFTKKDALRLIVSLAMLVWSYSAVSVKYSFAFMAVLFWDKFNFLNLRLFHRAIIATGLVCSLWFDGDGTRWSGFLSTSAPIFAFTLTISVTYLLFVDRDRVNPAVDVILIAIAIFLIWMTETRLFMAASAGLVLIRVIELIKRSDLIGQRYKTAIIRIVYLCTVIVVLTNIDWLYDAVNRDTGADSEKTRLDFLTTIFPEIIESPATLLLGHGGGFAEGFTEATSGATTNVPLHQDIVAYVVDYGVVGASLIALAFFRGVRWNWYLWVLLIASTFHNVLTSGSTLLLMYVTFQSICVQKETEITKRKR